MIVRYFETLRNNLNLYQNLTNLTDTTDIAGMYDLPAFYELCKNINLEPIQM